MIKSARGDKLLRVSESMPPPVPARRCWRKISYISQSDIERYLCVRTLPHDDGSAVTWNHAVRITQAFYQILNKQHPNSIKYYCKYWWSSGTVIPIVKNRCAQFPDWNVLHLSSVPQEMRLRHLRSLATTNAVHCTCSSRYNAVYVDMLINSSLPSNLVHHFSNWRQQDHIPNSN
jgi:hypothetical protein